jgi:hypothetical protein
MCPFNEEMRATQFEGLALFLTHFGHKWRLAAHGSLEAILSLTKMTQKTEIGDGGEVMSGALNNGFWNPARWVPSQLISKFKFFLIFL